MPPDPQDSNQNPPPPYGQNPSSSGQTPPTPLHPNNLPGNEKKSKASIFISIVVILIFVLYAGTHIFSTLRNRQIESEFNQDTASLSELEEGVSDRAFDIELSKIQFGAYSDSAIEVDAEIIHHGSSAKSIECNYRAGLDADNLRKVKTETYSVSPGSNQFTEIIDVEDADNDLLEVFVECLEYDD